MLIRDIPLDNLRTDYPCLFNGAIFKYNDNNFLAYRANKTSKDCKLFVSKTDKNWNPVGTSWEIRIPILYNLFEDPRFVEIKGKPYLLVTQVDLQTECQFQGVIELTDNLRYKSYFKINYLNNWTSEEKHRQTNSSNVHLINTVKDITYEKNWSFFEDEGKPVFIHRTQPVTIFTTLNNNFELEREDSSFKEFSWPFGEIRGGASTIKVNDIYYHFFHSSALAGPYHGLKEQGIGRIYYMGCYTFKKTIDGYELLEVTRIPLELGDFTDKVVLWRNCAVFPCGVVYEAGQFKISYGWHDYKIKLLTISLEELHSIFIPLREADFTIDALEGMEFDNVENTIKLTTMGRHKKNKTEVIDVESNVATLEQQVPKNDSLKNLNDIMSKDPVDEIFEEAEKDPNISICKSSIPVDKCETPKVKLLDAVPKDLTMLPNKQSSVTPPVNNVVDAVKDITAANLTNTEDKNQNTQDKSDKDAPPYIVAEDRVAANYSVYDSETDRLIQGAFYANRVTGTILAFLRNDKGQPLINKTEDGTEQPVLVLKNRKIHFKQNITI